MTANTFTLKGKAVFALYRYVVMPSVTIALPLIAIFNDKVRQGLRLRRQPQNALPEGLRPIWIHAASGEFEYAKAVIREIKRRAPEQKIVVTYFSPSFAKAVHNFKGVDHAEPLPLDLPGPCANFLKRMHPRMLLIARTDLWPEMLTRTRSAGIPIYLFSYTQKRLRGALARALTGERLRLVDRVFSVSRDDEKELDQIHTPTPHERLGDTRYDQVAFRLKNPGAIPLEKNQTQVFVAGSTWSEDEAVLLPALRDFLKENRLQLILVPHEPTPDHLREVEKEIAKLGLTSRKLSELKGSWFAENILLIDRIGVLAELYLLADFAFVGGSYRKTVHSVMEALGAGSMTFLGPKHLNNREALEFKELCFANFPGIQIAQDENELREKLEAALAHPKQLEEFKSELLAEFESRLGACSRLVDQLPL